MVSPIYDFPENASLIQLERERLPILAEYWAGNQLFPIKDEDADNILWEIRDDIQGMTYFVGPGEEFPNVDKTGVTRFFTPAGRFGESAILDAEKIERGRAPGQLGQALNVTAEMGDLQLQLAVREQTLIEYLRWQLLVFGTAKALRKDGTTVTVAQFTPQTAFSTTAWTSTSTAQPIQDLQAVRVAYQGYGHDFGSGALAFCNGHTGDQLMVNSNVADEGRVRLNYGETINDIPSLNKLMVGLNLPAIVSYDLTYLDTTHTPQRYIPDGYVVIVGGRPGTKHKVGDYVMTRNVNNPGGSPGIYVQSGIRERAPRTPWTERGHNGGLRQSYRRQVVVLKVF